MNTAFKIIMAAIYFWLFSITFGGIVAHGYWVVPDGDSAPVASFWNHYGAHVTHWMPLPEPPQEAK
ncbi:TPA: DUF551 domain-containing protein [Escherichia coli]